MNEYVKPEEPVLEVDKIQGIVVPGFLKPYQVLLQVTFPGARSDMATVCAALARWHADRPFSSARETLADRRAFRDSRYGAMHQSSVAGSKEPLERLPLMAIGFTYQGLLQLTPQVLGIPSLAFRFGMPARSGLLGDPVSADDPGEASKWVVGATGSELDALIVIAGNTPARVQADADELMQLLVKAGADCIQQAGAIREDMPGHEHFGFSDGISQPAIRGRESKAPKSYVSKRYLPASDPDSVRFGYPGQELVWPGEFVLGYPASSPDPLVPGPVREHLPWMRNGSFLVYRRLRQDVGAFWRTMNNEAARLSREAGFANMTAVQLASKMVGRWPSGAPLSRVPNADCAKLGSNFLANNDFRFDDNTPARVGLPGGSLRFPTAKTDIVGPACPVGSHIRKVNVRDQASDVGGTIATQSRRLLRVGIPYGSSVAEQDRLTVPSYGAEVKPEDDRGLLFLSIQASIEDQFEFLQRWMSNPSRPRGPGGHDMLASHNASTADGMRRCHLFGDDMQTQEVRADVPFVIPTGGGYFFVPSLPLLAELLQGAQLP
jgi:Dyp-type peroxidase family